MNPDMTPEEVKARYEQLKTEQQELNDKTNKAWADIGDDIADWILRLSAEGELIDLEHLQDFTWYLEDKYKLPTEYMRTIVACYAIVRTKIIEGPPATGTQKLDGLILDLNSKARGGTHGPG